MPPKRGKRVEESEESSEGSSDYGSKDEMVHVDPVEFVSKLAPDVRKRVHGLKAIQEDYNKQYEAYKEEMRQLEKKYEQLYDPLFAKRKDIVQGTVEPTEDEISKGAKVMEIKEEGEETKVEGETKGIPNFWLTALKNNEMTEEAITAKDEECLGFLKDITCKNFDDPNKGFTLTFYFDENPFFTNTELTKKYYLIDEDDIMLEKAEGCEIDWKPNKNLTVVMKKKKQKHKGGKNVRTVTKAEPCESFFNFFAPPKIPDGDCSDEEEEELEDMIEADYELGRTLKDKIIPRAVDWYTGEAIPTLEFEGGVGGGDDDDDDDEEEEEEKPKGKKKKGQITQGGAAKQPECQQQ